METAATTTTRGAAVAAVGAASIPAPDLLSPWLRYKASLHKRTPCTSNRASILGGGCEREIVYWRTRWEEALEPSLELQIIFQEGEKHEREVLLSPHTSPSWG